MNKKLPDETLSNILMMKLPDLKHWNSQIQFLRWINTDLHHIIQVVFDVKILIPYALHKHSGIKNHVV